MCAFLRRAWLMAASQNVRRARPLLAILVIVASAATAGAQPQEDWRFWTNADGLFESFSRKISKSPNGIVIVRHGHVRSMSLLDGYRIRAIPEPIAEEKRDLATLTRAYMDKSGSIWITDAGVLSRYTNERWSAVPVPGGAVRVLGAIPSKNKEIFVLTANAVSTFNPATEKWTNVKVASDGGIGEFTGIAAGYWGDWWVSGTHGIGHLAADSSPDGLDFVWARYTAGSSKLKNYSKLHPAPDRTLYASARAEPGNASVLVHLNGGGIKEVHRSSRAELQGWQGPNGELWYTEGTSFYRESEGEIARVPRQGLLGSSFYDVETESSGAFWIATADGDTLYSPAPWRTPEPILNLDLTVNAIAEDKRGTLWFAASDYLLSLTGTEWSRHPLPAGIRTHSTHVNGVWPAPDGSILIKGYRTDTTEVVLSYNPARKAFTPFLFPEGLSIGLINPRRDGRLFIATRGTFKIATYDGKNFEDIVDVPSTWQGGELRQILELEDGSLLLGGVNGLATLRAGKLRQIGPQDGYTETGGFALFDLGGGRLAAGGRKDLFKLEGGQWKIWQQDMGRVRSLLKQRDGSIWVASERGAHRLINGEWITNEAEDGLPATAVYRLFEDSKGRLWAGTGRGIAMYYPDSDSGGPELGAGNIPNPKEVAPDGSVRFMLDGTDKWNRTRKDRVLFSYRLDSAPWTPYLSSKLISFEKLPAGTHVLEYRAMDRNGNHSSRAQQLEFTVLLPWYRQGGFIALSLAATLAIVFLLAQGVSNYRQRSALIEELKNSRVAAESASVHKSEFLANMSHEIRTPMNAIVGMTQLALETPLNREQQDYLHAVRKASESLLGLLNDILDFTKIEAGKLQLANMHFDLKECVNDAIHTLSYQSFEKKLNLSLQFQEGVPHYLCGDPQRLRQVLVNLIGNAIKFTDSGSVRVSVRQTEANYSQVLQFTVADTGVGIPAEKQSIIFAPFEQGDGSKTRKYGGTGLGLAISAKLVSMMDGRIWVESPWLDPVTGEATFGSAFHFTASLALGQAPPESPVVAGEAIAAPLRVLVVEDNLINQKLAVKLLEKRGHLVSVACNGREALAMVQHQPFDVVLMDVQMPEMDGLQATIEIRGREKISGGHLPILALTAHAMKGDSERCLASGMDGYLSKPIRLEDLVKALEAIRPQASGDASSTSEHRIKA